MSCADPGEEQVDRGNSRYTGVEWCVPGAYRGQWARAQTARGRGET